MSDGLKTLVLGDDERTVVDASAAAPPVPSSRSAESRFHGARLWVRRQSKPAVAIVLTAVIGTWALAERQRADSLQSRIAALQSVDRIDGRDAGRRDDAAESSERALGSGSRPPAAEFHAEEVEFAGLKHGEDSVLLEPKAAAELIVGNRLREALFSYRRLAAERPGDDVYADVVRVLETKLACRSGIEALDVGCGY